MPAFKLAVVDDGGVYRGVVETVTDELLWVRSANRFPVPEGFDLPPHRYQLRRNRITGKEAFWSIVHDRDDAEENEAAPLQVNPGFIARALLKLNKGEKLSASDERKLGEYLASMDAQGETAP